MRHGLFPVLCSDLTVGGKAGFFSPRHFHTVPVTFCWMSFPNMERSKPALSQSHNTACHSFAPTSLNSVWQACSLTPTLSVGLLLSWITGTKAKLYFLVAWCVCCRTGQEQDFGRCLSLLSCRVCPSISQWDKPHNHWICVWAAYHSVFKPKPFTTNMNIWTFEELCSINPAPPPPPPLE